MEAAIALGSLKVAYHVLISGVKLDQVPDAVRRCIELVRTCHHDLEALIKLRNESLPILESKPAILDRINTIIYNAHRGLLEVARLVEKLRPEAHNGSAPLLGRLEWLFIDQREFTSQEPLISRQHASVIAELNFLRQLLLLAPLVQHGTGTLNGNTGGAAAAKKSVVAWENVALLDEMLGGKKTQPVPSAAERVSETQGGNMSLGIATGFSSPLFTDPPPPYDREPTLLQSAPQVTHPLIYNASVPTPLRSSGSDLARANQDQNTAKNQTSFDGHGVALLFSDVKSSLGTGTSQQVPEKPSISMFGLSSITSQAPDVAIKSDVLGPQLHALYHRSSHQMLNNTAPPQTSPSPGRRFYLTTNPSTMSLQSQTQEDTPPPQQAASFSHTRPTPPTNGMIQGSQRDHELTSSLAAPSSSMIHQSQSALDLANAKPLSTIPPELIHRFDLNEAHSSQPTALPVFAPRYTFAPLQPPMQDLTDFSSWRPRRSTSPTISSTNTPFAPPEPPPKTPLLCPQAPCVSIHKINRSTRAQSQSQELHFLGQPNTPVSRPVSAMSHLQAYHNNASVVSFESYREDQRHQRTPSMPTFISVRETGQPTSTGLPSELDAGYPVETHAVGKGTPAVEFHELSAVIFPDSPVELE